MKGIIAAITLIGVTTCYSQQLQDYRLLSNPRSLLVVNNNCTAPGPMCKNCQESAMCIEKDTGIFDQITMDKCTTGSTCFNGECTTNPNPSCDGTAGIKFPCQNIGMFPDPVDCRRFHICYGAAPRRMDYSAVCDDKHSYHSTSTYCKTDLVGPCTNYPVPICTKVGATGALDNPSIYYTCIMVPYLNKMAMYPALHVCPYGKKFDKNKCI